MSSRDFAVMRGQLADMLDLHLSHLRHGRDELDLADLPDKRLESILIGTAMLSVQYATAVLGLLLTDFTDVAKAMIADAEPNPEQLVMPDDADAAAALRDHAAKLLAGAWVGAHLTANVPPCAWPDDFPALCLAVAARSQVRHEIDADLDQLDDEGDQP